MTLTSNFHYGLSLILSQHRDCYKRHPSSSSSLYPVYTIKQSSSKHRANIEQWEHTLCTCIL